jgi:hypothetical protein
VFEISGGEAVQETKFTIGFVQKIFESFTLIKFGKGAQRLTLQALRTPLLQKILRV